ncbi:MAG: glycerol-3-phosphate acyltransferase [Dehalococcoidia bacterium]|nr:glycerol-3-phosphate acyltransferase [Dehalococcoidia bacterium]
MNVWLIFSLVFLGAYLLGSVPSAYLAARWCGGVDLRKVGTRSVGSSNVLHSVSKWIALPVLLFDVGKGALSVWVASLVGLDIGMQAASGLAAVIGHNWPVFLGFQGGRGIATSLGVVLALAPLVGIIILVGSYLFAPFKQHGLGVFIVVFLLPFLGWFLAGPLGIEEKEALTLGFAAITLIAFARRLIHHRSELSRTTPAAELIINRLLFDRDIRDRELWLRREQIDEAKV